MIPRDILRKVKRLEISTRHLVNDVFSGQYHSVFKGRGMEFNEVRQYQPGDDIRTIDWNVTARTGEPYVKRYVEERDLTVMLLVDLSRSQAFGTRSQRKSEVAAELCALLAFVAIRNHDRVGFLAFTDQVERFIPPAKGRRHGLRVIREVLAASPAGVRTDVGVALEHIGRVLKRRAVVFVISDFIAPDFATSFRTAAKRHDVVGMRLVDPCERELPALGLSLVEHLETGERLWVDLGRRSVRAAYEREASARAERVRRLFTTSGSDLIEIPVEADGAYVGPLIQFFRRRAARVRQRGRIGGGLLACVLLGTLGPLGVGALASDLPLRVEADRARFRVGDPVRLKVQVTAPPEARVILPGPDAALGPFELIAREPLAPDTLAGGEILYAEELTVTAFTLGGATLPPLSALVELADGRVATAVSDSLRLDIESVLPGAAADSDSVDIRPLKAQIELSGAGRRRLFLLLGALLLAALLLAATLWIRRRRRRAAGAVAPAPDLRPPDVIALAELEALRGAALARGGRMKAHYTRLTDIVRPYLERRFGFPAIDLTTAEILAAFATRLRPADCARPAPELRAELERLLLAADLVKFARCVPPAAVAEGEIDRAAEFVRATAVRPALAAGDAAATAPAEAAVP